VAVPRPARPANKFVGFTDVLFGEIKTRMTRFEIAKYYLTTSRVMTMIMMMMITGSA
jgi:hypothetical protein